MKIGEIIALLEEFAPLNLQLEWDNSGAQVGDFDCQATGALLTFDVTERSIQRAIEVGANLIISHHPLIFSGLKSITGATPTERIVMQAISHGIAIYACHTNIDCAVGGVSWVMAHRLELENIEPLCANGLGCLGDLPDQMRLDDFVQLVKTQYEIPYIRVNTDAPDKVRKVAVMGGSGGDEIGIAVARSADAMVTGDLKYHDFQRASNNLALIDIGHYESEVDILDTFMELILKKYATFALHTEKHSFVEIK